MKTLVVYDDTGNIIFTQTNAIADYACLVEDVADNKEVIGVDIETNKLILVDRLATTEEKEQLRLQLESKNNELESTLAENEKLTDKIIELTAQNLINE